MRFFCEKPFVSINHLRPTGRMFFGLVLLTFVQPMVLLAQCELVRLHGSDARTYDLFGTATAIDEDWVLIGASHADHSDLENAGEAYLFRRVDRQWVEAATLRATDAAAGDFFGTSVAISGAFAFVGASHANAANAEDAGAVYVFRREDDTWTQRNKLVPSVPVAFGNFGLSLSTDGQRVAIGGGAPRQENDALGPQAVYIFRRDGLDWIEETRLTGSDSIGPNFGFAVALQGDGLIVGAPLEDHATFEDAGAVYVFRRTQSGWTQEAQLTSSDEAPGNRFGWSVALAGETALIGAIEDDLPGGEGSGSAYVFRRSDGSWREEAKLTAANPVPFSNFGNGVALRGDIAAVSAPYEFLNGGFGGGAVYFFRKTGEEWSQASRVTASDAAPGDRFGYSLSLFGDFVVTGAPYNTTEASIASGSVYVLGLSALDCNEPPSSPPLCGTGSAAAIAMITGLLLPCRTLRRCRSARRFLTFDSRMPLSYT